MRWAAKSNNDQYTRWRLAVTGPEIDGTPTDAQIEDIRTNQPNITILARATQSLGRTPKILLSSWSPPAALKASGKEMCNDGDADYSCTLIKDANGFVYDQFADYFVQSLAYYAASGIVPDYLSIQNEPNFVPNGWEGCRFEGTEGYGYPGYDQALSAVHAALASVPDAPKLIGPEPMSLDNSVLDAYMTDKTRPLLDGVAHHSD